MREQEISHDVSVYEKTQSTGVIDMFLTWAIRNLMKLQTLSSSLPWSFSLALAEIATNAFFAWRKNKNRRKKWENKIMIKM